jgi:heme/copper-type cytochrome/quinol oxidase subunit 4
MKKLFYIINFCLAILLPLFSFNIIISKSDPNHFFPLIFICLGFCDTLLGINLLNANKKLLSVSSFILAGFLFILVGSKICIYN